jgi:hypothetical protein
MLVGKMWPIRSFNWLLHMGAINTPVCNLAPLLGLRRATEHGCCRRRQAQGRVEGMSRFEAGTLVARDRQSLFPCHRAAQGKRGADRDRRQPSYFTTSWCIRWRSL